MFSENVFDDFDAQSEQLSGYDQEYFQMSRGSFRGRFVSAVVGPAISLHLETTNQALEQRVGCPAGMVSLGIVMGKGDRFEANGMGLTGDRLMINQPGCELSLKSPAGGAILAVCIDQNALMSQFGGETVPALFDSRANSMNVIDAPMLARQIRISATEVLTKLRQPRDDTHHLALAEPLLSALSAQFALHDAILQGRPAEAPSQTYRTYDEARKLMLDGSMEGLDYTRLSSNLHRSRRSIQLAFARHAQMSPSNFYRTLRLSKVRRALISGGHQNLSIGDIASVHGFWSWSQFTQLYKIQFGELPSETRSRWSPSSVC